MNCTKVGEEMVSEKEQRMYRFQLKKKKEQKKKERNRDNRDSDRNTMKRSWEETEDYDLCEREVVRRSAELEQSFRRAK